MWATGGAGKGVVQTQAQRGGGQGDGGRPGRVHLDAVLSGRAGDGHPGPVRLPLSHRQLLTQVCCAHTQKISQEDLEEAIQECLQ